MPPPASLPAALKSPSPCKIRCRRLLRSRPRSMRRAPRPACRCRHGSRLRSSLRAPRPRRPASLAVASATSSACRCLLRSRSHLKLRAPCRSVRVKQAACRGLLCSRCRRPARVVEFAFGAEHRPAGPNPAGPIPWPPSAKEGSFPNASARRLRSAAPPPPPALRARSAAPGGVLVKAAAACGRDGRAEIGAKAAAAAGAAAAADAEAAAAAAVLLPL